MGERTNIPFLNNEHNEILTDFLNDIQQDNAAWSFHEDTPLKLKTQMLLAAMNRMNVSGRAKCYEELNNMRDLEKDVDFPFFHACALVDNKQNETALEMLKSYVKEKDILHKAEAEKMIERLDLDDSPAT